MNKTVRHIGIGAVALGLCVPMAIAKDQDRSIEPGTTIVFRTSEPIDVEGRDDRVYRGVVDQDVRENGRLAIPRGSRVELKVRVAPDNDLVLDLESVNVNGQPYAVRADGDGVEAQRDDNLVGAIVGADTGVQVRGRAISVPRDSVLTFRIDGVRVPDPGEPLYERQNHLGSR
jgi:hypothetical protein